LLLLTTSTPQRLLPTVLSRCQRFRFSPLAPDWMEPRLVALFGATPQQARLAASVSQGSMLAAERYLAGDLHEIRDKAVEILKWAASGRDLELLETAQALAQEHPKRRHAVPLLLQMLCVAARDALLLESGVIAPARAQAPAAGAATLANTDRAADVQEIARAYTPGALRTVLRGAERTDRQIAGHAAVEHTLAAFFLDVARAAAQNAPRAAARGG
jgi:hypothetical protein